MGLADTPTELPAGQLNLLGEPILQEALSQWFTPMYIAYRLAAWIPRGTTILEPSCGSGNIIAALLAAGHKPEHIRGIELDPAWAAFARNRFEGRVRIDCHDFLDESIAIEPCQVVAGNPPFEDDLHARFVRRSLDIAPRVVNVLPHSIEYGIDRDIDLWSKGIVRRRARLPQRVHYGGRFSASFETVCLVIDRRTEPRRLDEVAQVMEEVWRKDLP